MANFIENLGLEFLTETEEDRATLLGVVAQSGKAIMGYYGYPYINRHFGDAQFIVRTWINEEMKNIEIIGMDTHCSGNCVWEARLFDTIVFVNINRDGLMSEIMITTDDRYHFKLDEQFQPTNPFEDVNVNSVIDEIKGKATKDINGQQES